MTDLAGPVQVIGTGLLGTSIGLALTAAGVEVLLTDRSDDALRTASGLGAGRPLRPGDRPALVVVAVPPVALGPVLVRALADTAAYDAVVTDVGSVKSGPLATVLADPAAAAQAHRYVGSHPMAGSERSGPLAASAALFDGRPWAVTPHEGSDPAAVTTVEALVTACGGVLERFTPAEHDRAVARTSHVPHLMAALAAGRLAQAPAEHLTLSGQGVRDVTRVAAGDPALYGQIVSANADAVLALLGEIRGRLDDVIAAVGAGDRDRLEGLLAEGVAGAAAIPGKHGGPVRPVGSVYVAVPDHPGELARLFAEVGTSGVNIEDVRIDHDPGRPVGLVELVVDRASTETLATSLDAGGWVTHR